MSEQQKKRVMYIISCGTPVAQRLYNLVPLLQSEGWETCVVLTPMATRFVDGERLHQLTRHPVYSEYKGAEDFDDLPRADAAIIFPMTFNTLNKWAAGISDTLALGLLCRLTGLKVPMLGIPIVREGGGLDTHPAFASSLHLLRGRGVHIFYRPDIYPPRNEILDEGILRELRQIV